MDISKFCFFTGHRVLPKYKINKISILLKKEIKKLIGMGVDTFISGGALGFDMLCADIVLELKKDFPYLKLYIFLPCYNFSDSWSLYDKYHIHMILSKSDKFTFITEGNYTIDCMKFRNFALVNDAFFGIAYYNHYRSGTGQTIRYADKKNRCVINIAEDI